MTQTTMTSTSDSTRVLIVQCNHPAYHELVERLHLEVFDVTEAPNGRELLAKAREGGFDFIIIDMVMGGVDGLSVLRTLRAAGDWTPILVYATRSSDVDAMLAFELGADDFVEVEVKRPDRELVSRGRELVSRMRAIMRRGKPTFVSAELQEFVPGKVLRFGSLEIDENARDARVDGKPLNLRPREFSLLLALAKQPGVALSRKTLVDRVWGYDYFGDERTVDNHVRQIRAKLESTVSSPAPLRTIYGYGYRFEANQGGDRH